MTKSIGGRWLAISVFLAPSSCSTSLVAPADTPGDDAGDVDPPMTLPDGGALPDPLAGCTPDPGAPQITVNSSAASDPIGAANFTLTQALAGFPTGAGVLTAAITTEKSTILCQLDEAAAPISVANFVGLARGTRPYLNSRTNQWMTGHFYDGLIWHRVIPNFVIQGGDPLGNGTGGPGYVLPQENHGPEDLGALAMAAATAPNGSQFYIVVGTGPDPNYNVFGHCSTDAAIAIANVPRDANDKPTSAVHMRQIRIGRCPAK